MHNNQPVQLSASHILQRSCSFICHSFKISHLPHTFKPSISLSNHWISCHNTSI